MGGAKKLQTEVDEAVLSTADAAQALREITALLCQRTRSPVALLARWEDEERGASPLAHPGLSAPLAEKLCAALAPFRAALQAIREGALTATLNTNPREMGRILMRTVVRGLNRRERVEAEIQSPINIVDPGNVMPITVAPPRGAWGPGR